MTKRTHHLMPAEFMVHLKSIRLLETFTLLQESMYVGFMNQRLINSCHSYLVSVSIAIER